ncbi:hypothetical protein HMPREF9574_01805 [Cutibacterium acnes HL074PA1]|nr:hypothetical protein HMPREF9574_01805 [Cutibacterium acnes HL074PA1]
MVDGPDLAGSGPWQHLGEMPSPKVRRITLSHPWSLWAAL